MCSRSLMLLIAVGVVGCSKKTTERAEVEFVGKWQASGISAAKVDFVAQQEPCLPLTPAPTLLGSKTLDHEGTFGAEFFVPQGSRGHLCLFASDANGKVIGVASYDKNPLTFSGAGEIVIGPFTLALSKVD